MATLRGTVTHHDNGTYALTFHKKDDLLSSEVEQRMITTFFVVYPQIVSRFNSNSACSVQFTVDPNFNKCPAVTSGANVTFSAKWLQDHPADTDIVTHELMHIVQDYSFDNPTWLVEGIADYVREKYGMNNVAAGWSMPNYCFNQMYTDSYRVTARFLIWLESRINSSIVEQLDKCLRQGSYTEQIWQQLTGKTIDQLWNQYAHNPHFSDSEPRTGTVSDGVYKLININSSKALDVANSGTKNGTNVQIYTNNDTSAQKWHIQNTGDGSYKLINIICGKVLDVEQSSTLNGTNVQIWEDNGTAAQRWNLKAIGDENIYKLVNVICGKALDVDHSGTADCTNVQIWTDNNTAAQKWRLTQLS
ncbi:unnamed protein product [Rotaria sp. Silwood2]|nr:unnamed protein product [Rotaria sp. Silwood2]CAF3894327.1 unnamed protein product [Rotaria sp. Silwood2]